MADRIELSRICIPLLPSQSQAKRKGAGARTWLVVSKSGKISFEELGKNTVMRRSGITAHDLRVVEPELSYPSAVLRRESAVVVNLEHIKAIVTANEVLVPNPRDPRMASFVYDLESKLSDFGAMKHRLSGEKGWAITNPNLATMTSDKAMEQSLTYMPPEASGSKRKASNGESKRMKPKPLPFEFRALEICLESVCKSLESETSTLEEEAYPALDQLSAKTKTNNLKRVRVIKGRLVALTGRVQKVRNEFEHLLDDDTDMAQMYLTDKLATLQTEGLVPEDEIDDAYTFLSGDHINEETSSKSSTVDLKPNVEEVEMLLGAYFVEIEGILNKLSTLQEYVHDTEDYINIVLDDKQNQLLRMGLFISTASFMVTLAVVAIGFMSINIHIDLFDGAYNQWYAAFGGCSVGSVVLYIIVILVFKWLRLFG